MLQKTEGLKDLMMEQTGEKRVAEVKQVKCCCEAVEETKRKKSIIKNARFMPLCISPAAFHDKFDKLI